MKRISLKNTGVFLLFCLPFVMFQISQVEAFSVKELLGSDKLDEEATERKKSQAKLAEVTKKTTTSEWGKEAADGQAAANPQLDINYFIMLFSNMNEQERNKILSEPDIFKQIVENEANNRSAISSAIANKLEQDKNIMFLMRRSAKNILRESYLNLLSANKLPADFPTADQVAEYYKNNKQQFVTPERIHVWQIFLQKAPDADAKQIASLKKKANKIVSKLKKAGGTNFDKIALSESDHPQSKTLGGYLGILNTSDLLPELKQTILKLKEGELSQPVESKSGIHILKRGKILAKEPLQFNQVEGQIRQLLVRQANAQLRKAIFEQARKEFPQDISGNKLEAWRLRLKTRTYQ